MAVFFSVGLLAPNGFAWAQNTFPTSGPTGVGTSSPGSSLEVSTNGMNYWNLGSNNWNGTLNPPQSLMVTNSQPGGYDPVIIGRMATSTGNLKPAFALGAVGADNWTDGNLASQIADFYLVSRDATGTLQERLRISSRGYVGIGTSSPAAPLEVSTSGVNYWTPGSNSWSGTFIPPQSLVVTNRQPGGYDPVIIGRMATSAGNLKPAFALGAVGANSWADSNLASQIADVYLVSRDTTGALKERLRVNSRGYVGIATSSPAALLHVAGDVLVDGNLAAKYQDVAEWVKSERSLPAATVVIIDPQESNRVIASREAYDTRVAGVISAKPGLLLVESGDDKVKVAHSGRVKVKVDAGQGAVAVGDLLVTSTTPGEAMRSEPVNVGGVRIHRPGTLIGKALEPLDQGVGEILVLLMLQ